MKSKICFIFSVLIICSLCFLECGKKSPTKSDNQNTTNPNTPSKTYKIAYSSSQENWEIFLMNMDGSNSKRLTHHETISQEPAWSPDGSQIAYLSWINGTFSYALYIMNTDGSNAKPITNTEEIPARHKPHWSPSGDRIALVDEHDRLWVMNTDGTNQKMVTTNCWGPAKWNPDGLTLLFSYDGFFDSTGIGVINADGTNFKLLCNESIYQLPDWSPDGHNIAYISNRDGNSDNFEIYTMASDGTNRQRLTNNEADDNSPSWSPDGSKIAFVSNRDDQNYEVYVMNRDGSNLKRVSNVPRYILYEPPIWSPDGKIIFVEAEMRNGCSHCDIWIVNTDGSEQKKLTVNESIDNDPACSPIPVL